MKISDRVFGEFEIKSQLILELINCAAFQRLKKINQYGGVNLVYPDCYQVSRFEHSIGVWYVAASLGLNLELQIAALLHDLGHTAFSHMVDQALESDSEDFHEDNMHLIPGIEKIYSILEREGLGLKPVDQYPEIKTPLPAVGADRLDYALRDYFGALNKKTDLGIRTIESITLIDRKIVFTDLNVVTEFALTGLKAMWEVIYAPRVAVVYQALTEILRQGIKQGWILTADLFTDDQTLLNLILKQRNELRPVTLEIFEKKFTVIPVDDTAEFDFKHLKKKVRYFDPPVIVNDQIFNLSEINQEFKLELAQMLKIFEQRKIGECYRVEFS